VPIFVRLPEIGFWPGIRRPSPSRGPAVGRLPLPEQSMASVLAREWKRTLRSMERGCPQPRESIVGVPAREWKRTLWSMASWRGCSSAAGCSPGSGARGDKLAGVPMFVRLPDIGFGPGTGRPSPLRGPAVGRLPLHEQSIAGVLARKWKRTLWSTPPPHPSKARQIAPQLRRPVSPLQRLPYSPSGRAATSPCSTASSSGSRGAITTRRSGSSPSL